MVISKCKIGVLFLTIVVLGSSVLIVQSPKIDGKKLVIGTYHCNLYYKTANFNQQFYFTHYDEDFHYANTVWDSLFTQQGKDALVVLWWTPFASTGKLKKCGDVTCYFTDDRKFETHDRLKSILFYGSNIELEDLPRWRSRSVTWGIMHEESPRNNPMLVHDEALSLFNYSSTFSRLSDVPLTLIDLPGIDHLISKKYFVNTEEKIRLLERENLAPLLYIQSDCNTASNRDLYISELMKHIKVDSYGACLNNAQLEKKFKENYLESLNSQDFLSFVSKYMFTIAFENAVCQDYITEKLWRPLVVGSVPVYYGSPTFQDWLPNNRSAISVRDFPSPKELANFLHLLIKNASIYNEYLLHKLNDDYELENERLVDALRNRPLGGRNEFGNYVEEFECFVCKNSAKDTNEDRQRIVTTKQYDCPLPKNPITNELDNSNWWLQQWILEKCSAKLLGYNLANNITFDVKSFEKKKLEMYRTEECTDVD